jgi:hypothetical protein
MSSVVGRHRADAGRGAFEKLFEACEDAIDALVSAWVGLKYLRGEVEAFGDEYGAIRAPAVVR